MKHEKFSYNTIDELKAKIDELKLNSIPLSEDLSVLGERFTADGHEFQNRIAIQPMEGCDGTFAGSPDELTYRRYRRFAESGAALIWLEATAIVNEGRANPRQLLLNNDTVEDFKKLVDEIRETSVKRNGFAPKIFVQATHSGRYAKPEGKPAPMIAYNNPIFEKDNPIDKSRIVSDDYLKALEERYGEATILAQKAGFDGIDVKCCHRYLFSELLSAFNREGEYGGSFENRTRLYLNSIKNAKSAASDGFVVTSRLNVYDGFPRPNGFGVGEEGVEPDLTESKELVKILHKELGVNILDITIGNPYFNPHVNRPYDAGGYIPEEHPLEGVNRMYKCVGEIQKTFPDLCVIGSGVSYMRQFSPNLAAGAVKSGIITMQGFGREAFAYPDFPHDIFEKGELSPNKCCITCGKCTELMRAGTVSGCVIRDSEKYMPIYKEYCMK